MKYVLAIAATLISTTAFAGGYNPPAVEQPVIAPVFPVETETGSDWTGGYAGLQYGKGNGKNEFSSPKSSDSFDVDGYGIHGGYLHDFGQLVAGSELDFNKVEDDNSKVDLWRLRGRVGYGAGRFMPYVTLGAAHISGNNNKDFSETGISYGIGTDFKVTEKFTVGAEYSRVSFDKIKDLSDKDMDINLIQIRGAFHF